MNLGTSQNPELVVIPQCTDFFAKRLRDMLVQTSEIPFPIEPGKLLAIFTAYTMIEPFALHAALSKLIQDGDLVQEPSIDEPRVFKVSPAPRRIQ